MKKDSENLLLGVGPLVAIGLGVALMPLRSFTSASNFTFVFIILNILVAEYGGKHAALLTAVCSALSLDFFLTRPYLRLTIVDKHDLIAFGWLSLCGLLVAALSSARANRAAELESARRQLGFLHSAVAGLESDEPIESRLGKLLDAARAACPLAAAAVRDEQNSIVAALERGGASRPLPVQVLSPATMLPRGDEIRGAGPAGLPFPEEGARVPLVVRGRQVGWLDLWGNQAPATAEIRRTLTDVAVLLTMLLAARKDRALHA